MGEKAAMIEAALQYARRGWPVLALTPSGKAPLGRLVPRGFRDATTDAAVLRRWWTDSPEANVGVRTGDGLAVLDVDRREDGERTLDAYIHNSGSRGLDTPQAHTGDGWHLYLAAPAGQRCRRLGPGLDLKAEGGYVVAPPSLHPCGKQYAWDPARTFGDVALAELPTWAAERPSERRATPPDEWAAIVAEGAAEGSRNDTTARLAGRYLRFGLDPYEVLGLLLAWNRTCNRPPLADAEVERVVLSIARRETEHLERRGR